MGEKCKRTLAIVMVICMLLVNTVVAYADDVSLYDDDGYLCAYSYLWANFRDGVGSAYAEATGVRGCVVKLKLFYTNSDGEWGMVGEGGYDRFVCIPEDGSYTTQWTDNFASETYVRSGYGYLIAYAWLFE